MKKQKTILEKCISCIWFICTICFLFFVSQKWGSIPPLAAFFSPYEGFWVQSNSLDTSIPNSISAHLKSTSQVVFDSLGVAHIFAENEHDAFFLQGFVTARDRLFQMEVASRLAAGRLAEWLGPNLLETDRYFRRIGLTESARIATQKILKDSLSASILYAYADGVNAYINSLSGKDYPLEYKILDIKPELWTPLSSILILKNVTFTLTASFDDLRFSNSRAIFGNDFVKNILLKEFDKTIPVIPDFTTNPQIKTPKGISINNYFKADLSNQVFPLEPDKDNGSNNWAISGKKTASKKAILANDPHLGLTLPSIWYETELNLPETSVHGFSVAGTPAITLGFTPWISWGVTNSGGDVADFYQIEFKDASKQEYKHDNQWKKINQHIEKIQVRGEGEIVDTVLYTHHGPIVFDSPDKKRQSFPSNAALKWIAHDTTSNELISLRNMMYGKNYSDFVKALSDFGAPALNWAFASSEGDIAMWVNGHLPQKWKYQGLFISDGSDSRYDWTPFIPHQELPHELNPKRGFVSSANQLPVSEKYPFYFGDKFGSFERPNRISELLDSAQNLTIESVAKMQFDSYSLAAKDMLTIYLKALQTKPIPDSLLKLVHLLKAWDYVNKAEQVAPTLFNAWRANVSLFTWDEFKPFKQALAKPWKDQTDWLMLNEPNSSWFDIKETQEVETLDDILILSFYTTISELNQDFGAQGNNWNWGNYNRTDIQHIASIPGFNSGFIPTDGFSGSINAIRNNHGPSFRMVVEMDGWNTKALINFPGGQSGNPASPLYTDRIENWLNQTSKFIKLYKTADEIPSIYYRWKWEKNK